jgi:hypothetical protein
MRMPPLGSVIAERVLQRQGSKRTIRARLGKPRPSRVATWECPFQVVGAGDPRVRLAYGEDALQTVILACAGLRRELTRAKADWLGMGDSGIPPYIPNMFSPALTAHLERVIEKEMRKLLVDLKRAHKTGKRRGLAALLPKSPLATADK